MIVIPAIDLMGGRCVRLVRGQKDDAIYYDKKPMEVAEEYYDNGAKIIHVVDLDGAFSGEMDNMPIIAELAKRFPIQVGGGVRNENRLKQLLYLGVKKVIVSSIFATDPKLASELKKRYYGKIIGSFDLKDGKLSYSGWMEQSEERFEDVTRDLAEVVVTDTTRDGTLEGPNIEMIETLKQKTDAKIISAGGIRDIADLKALSKLGIYGAIAGRAFLEGRIGMDCGFEI